jgi:hypothetical protein
VERDPGYALASYVTSGFIVLVATATKEQF